MVKVANRYLCYGSYVFPSGFKVMSISNSYSIPEAKKPREDGAILLRGTQEKKIIRVSGNFIKGVVGNTTNFRDSLDAFYEAMNDNPNWLYTWDDRRYRCMRPQDIPQNYDDTWFGRMAGIEITFIGPDPYQYGLTNRTDTWSSPTDGSSHSLSVSIGNAPVLPLLTIVVGGSGAVSFSIEITNDTTGEVFTFNKSITGGDILTIDSLLKHVKVNDVSSRAYFDGQFLTYNQGTNNLSIVINGGSISSIVSSWYDRWY